MRLVASSFTSAKRNENHGRITQQPNLYPYILPSCVPPPSAPPCLVTQFYCSDGSREVEGKLLNVAGHLCMLCVPISCPVLSTTLWTGTKLGQFAIVDTKPTQAHISRKIVSSSPAIVDEIAACLMPFYFPNYPCSRH